MRADTEERIALASSTSEREYTNEMERPVKFAVYAAALNSSMVASWALPITREACEGPYVMEKPIKAHEIASHALPVSVFR